MSQMINQTGSMRVHISQDMIEVPTSWDDPSPLRQFIPGLRRCTIDFETTEDLPLLLGVHPVGQKMSVYDKRNDEIWDGTASQCRFVCGIWFVVLSGCVPRHHKPCWLCGEITKFRRTKYAHVVVDDKTYEHLICTECECYTECEEVLTCVSATP